MTSPSQQPGGRRRKERADRRVVFGAVAALVAISVGMIFVLDTDLPSMYVRVGIAIIAVSVLTVIAFVMRYVVKSMQRNALREPGSVEVLAVTPTYHSGRYAHWELVTELEIQLDGGPTFRGTYRATVQERLLREWWWSANPPARGRLRRRLTPKEALDDLFRVGARLRCRYDPADPDEVLVFPVSVDGDTGPRFELANQGSTFVWFHSAT